MSAPHLHGAGPGEPHAGSAHHDEALQDPRAFWEDRYRGEERVWSGRVNATLADLAAAWTPGRSLDLGCGEGADVLWLAEHGWDAYGIDLSATAIERARAETTRRGLEHASFTSRDLTAWAREAAAGPGARPGNDLVTASFFQSPVALDRELILRAAANTVTVGGRLALVSHAAPPPWASGHPGPFPTPASELELLGLDPARWDVEAAELRTRPITGPDGAPTTIDDTAVVARRTA